MKLYTEEQVIEAYNKGRTDWINELEDNNILYTMIPIELPSNEQIEELSKNTNFEYDYFNYGFVRGAKWMKEQILNQNK